MQKKTKNALAAVLIVLFTLSVGYFALVAPTTAWYYQEENVEYSFEFGDFDVEQENREEITTAIPLRAATRFADVGEVLFDEVIHVVKVDAENIGKIAAQVNVSVTESENNPAGLKWFVYDTSLEAEIPDVTGGVIAEKGVYKNAIEAMLAEHNVAPVDYASLTSSDIEAEYESYNESAVEALKKHNADKIVFNSGEERVVYVVFWAEYGEVKESLDVDNTVTLGDYDVNIEFEATPYIPEYAEILIKNDFSSDVNLKLFLNGSEFAYTGEYYCGEEAKTASNGLIGATSGEDIIVKLEVGTQYRMELVGIDLSARFSDDESDGTVTDKLITGAVTNYGNYVKIIAK